MPPPPPSHTTLDHLTATLSSFRLCAACYAFWYLPLPASRHLAATARILSGCCHSSRSVLGPPCANTLLIHILLTKPSTYAIHVTWHSYSCWDYSSAFVSHRRTPYGHRCTQDARTCWDALAHGTAARALYHTPHHTRPSTPYLRLPYAGQRDIAGHLPGSGAFLFPITFCRFSRPKGSGAQQRTLTW